MTPRFNYAKSAPGVYDAMDALDQYLTACGLEATLLHLVRLRASLLNGCAYCIDMHWKDLRALGESEQRLYALAAWREYSIYSDRERAALEWAEALTMISDGQAGDGVYESVRAQFNGKELADLTCAVATINAWNRLSIAARPVPGNYKPSSFAEST